MPSTVPEAGIVESSSQEQKTKAITNSMASGPHSTRKQSSSRKFSRSEATEEVESETAEGSNAISHNCIDHHHGHIMDGDTSRNISLVTTRILSHESIEENDLEFSAAVYTEAVDDIAKLTKPSTTSIVEALKRRCVKEERFYIQAGCDVLLKISQQGSQERRPLLSKQLTECFKSISATRLTKFCSWQRWKTVEWLRDQAIVLFGERGSGKTDTLMEILHTWHGLLPPRSTDCNLHSLLLSSQKLLQIFGNISVGSTANRIFASTFMQAIQLSLDFAGSLAGCSITHSVPEQARVIAAEKSSGSSSVSHGSFQIFYSLLLGSDVSLLKQLKLQRNPNKYAFLKPYECESLHSAVTTESFRVQLAETKKHFQDLQFSLVETKEVFLVLAVILKLSNLIFQPAVTVEATCSFVLENEFELLEICAMIGCEANQLKTFFNEKIIELPKSTSSAASSASASVTLTHLQSSAEDAEQRRNRLCRNLYSRLFSWIVGRLNQQLKGNCESGKHSRIHIVDLPGFYSNENKTVNSFDQFLNNYANERIFAYYVGTKLKESQHNIIKEGIQWKPIDSLMLSCETKALDTMDACLMLLEQPNASQRLLSLSSPKAAAAGSGGSGLAKNCIDKCKAFLPSSDALSLLANKTEYIVKHYAKSVKYSLADCIQIYSADSEDSWFDREISEVFDLCSCNLLKHLFPLRRPDKSTKPLAPSAQFKLALNSIMAHVEKSECSFIFCITAQSQDSILSFDDEHVGNQVHCLKLPDLCTLIKQGFAFDETYTNCFDRYRMLSPFTWPTWTGPHKIGVMEVLRFQEISSADVAFGRCRLYFRRSETVEKLEQKRRRTIHRLASLIQRTYRHWHHCCVVERRNYCQTLIASNFRVFIARKKFGQRRSAAVIIQSVFRGWRVRHQIKLAIYRRAIQRITRFLLKTSACKYLRKLAHSLPSDSPNDAAWPKISPKYFSTANDQLRMLHHGWRCRRYRLKTDQQSYFKLREKLAASVIFKDRKSLYPLSVGHPFRGDYIRIRQNHKWRKLARETSDDYVVFADIISKVHVFTGKVSTVLLVLSTVGVVLLDVRTLTLKYRCPATDIYKISLSPYSDNVAVLHFQSLSLSKRKGDFIFESRHIIEVVAKLFLVIQNDSGKQPIIEINSSVWIQSEDDAVEVSFRTLEDDDADSLFESPGCFSASSPSLMKSSASRSGMKSPTQQLHSILQQRPSVTMATASSSGTAAASASNHVTSVVGKATDARPARKVGSSANLANVPATVSGSVSTDLCSVVKCVTPTHRAKFYRKGLKLEVTCSL